MSLLSYLTLDENAGKLAYQVRRVLKPYREYLERQIQCIDLCNVVKKAKWTLLKNPPKNKDDENLSVGKKEGENGNGSDTLQKEKDILYKIRLDPINENDDLDVFFTDENLGQLYEMNPIEITKKVRWDDKKECRKLQIDSVDEERYVLFLKKIPTMPWIAVRPDTYQLRKQKEAIESLQENPKKSLSPIINLFADMNEKFDLWKNVEQSHTESSVEWTLLGDSSFDGVDEQRQFVLNVLNTPDFAFLEGPPGSGKTRAICEAIRLLIAAGKRVLLCASTHVAVDNVLERLMDEENEWRKQIIPIRIARNESRISSDIAKKYSLRTYLKEEKARINKELKKRIRSAAQNAMLDFVDEDSNEADGLMRLILDSANLVCGTTIGILQHPDIKRASGLMAPFDYLIIDEASKTTFQEFLVPAMWAKRWILVGDVNQLSPYVDDAELSNNLKFFCPDEVMRNIASDIFHTTSKNKREQYRVLVECEDKELKDSYIKYCKLTHSRYFDLDSSGKLSLNECGIFLAKSSRFDRACLQIKQLKLVQSLVRPKNKSSYKIVDGKIRQDSFSWESDMSWRLATSYELRKSEESKNKERLDGEIEELCNLMTKISEDVKPRIESLRRVALPSILELLKDGFEGIHEMSCALTLGLPSYVYDIRAQKISFQHRMHPEIAELSKKYVYNGNALNSSENMVERRSSFFPCSKHIIWIGKMKNRSALEDEKLKNANSHECEIIMKKLESFVAWAKQHPNFDKNTNGLWEVAVLSFYQGQERLLWKKLAPKRKEWGKYIRLNVCTIDRFQGHEADLVFVSFVKSYPTSFLLSTNRLNVALTRAKYQCFLVGNREALHRSLENGRQNEFLYRITDEIDYEKAF